MEEKILIPQADLSFDIQRFADNSADSTETYSLRQNELRNIDGITYSATDQDSVVEVTADTITLKSGGAMGNISVGAGSESLNGKNFVVDSGVEAMFNLQNADSVTINGIVYKAKENIGLVTIVYDEISLNGNFEITITQGTPFTLGDLTFTANSSTVTFTYDSSNNVSNISGSLNLTSAKPSKNILVDGVTYKGKGDLSFTDAQINLNGMFTVGNGTESLSGKKFAFNSSSNVTVTLAKGDSNVNVNDVTGSAGEESLQLTFSGDKINIYGNGATVNGTGNFVIYNSDSAVNINGIDVKSNDNDAAISFTNSNTVNKLSSVTVGNDTNGISNLNLAENVTISNTTLNIGSNGTINLGGITYSGNGSVTVGDTTDNVTLSGTSMSVDTSNADLIGKNISFTGDCKVDINGVTYSAANSSSTGSVSFNSTGETTISNSFVAFDEQTTKTLTISSGNDLIVDGVTYTAKNSDAKVTVDGTSVQIDSGTVAVDSTSSDYSVKLATNTTAQIKGVDFKKTASTTRSSTADISVENGNITLNAGFEVGDGTQKLDNLTVTLTTSDKSIFNLGGGNVTVIQNSGESHEVTGDTTSITGVTYSGTGTVSVTDHTATLTATGDNTIEVSGSTNEYTFVLTSGGSYKFGNATINATNGNTTVSNFSNNSITIGNKQYSTTDEVTLSVGNGNNVTVTSGSITYTDTTTTFTFNNETYTNTSDNNSITYMLDINSTTPTVYNATGTRAYQSTENKTVAYSGYTYNVTAGTYSIEINSGTGTPTLAGSATKTFTAGESFSYTLNNQSHNYTAETNGVTYNITFNGDVITSDTKTGSGTRNDGEGEPYTSTDTNNGGTYTLSSGAIMKLTFGNTPEEVFYSGSATRTTDSYITGGKTYTTSNNDLTLTLTKSAGGSDTVALTNGTGTRINNENFTYPPGTGGKTYSGDVTYTLTADNTNESLYSANGTRTNVSRESYAVGNNTYTLNSGTYQIDVTGGSTTASETLTSGAGTTTKNTAFTINNDATTYTPLNDNVTLNLSVSNSTPTESFTDAVTYVNSNANQTFTGQDDKTYTTSSITYKKQGSSDATPTVYNATGTRDYTADDNVTFPYQGNNYTVTVGTYTDSVSSGTRTIPTLTSTTAVFTAGIGNTFKTSETSPDYTATAATTFTLNSGNNTPTTSGSGTRTASGEEYTSQKGNTYTLSASTYQIDLPTTTDYLIGGSATKTVNTSDSFTVNGKTYTPKDNTVTLTLSFSGNEGTTRTENETFSGKGTRQATEETSFTYSNGKTYSSNDIVKITENGAAESLYSANGTRTNVSGESYAVGNNTYTLNSGTYQIDVTGGSTTASETLTSGEGTAIVSQAFTINNVATTYTPLNGGNVTLSLSVSGASGTNKTESFSGNVTYTDTATTFTATNNKIYTNTSGNNNITYKKTRSDDNSPTVYTATGTRAFGVGNPSNNDSATDSYKGDTYNVVSGTYTVNVTTGTPTETLTKSQATYSVGAGTRFHFGTREGRNTFTATEQTTLTLGYNENGSQTGLTAASGAGTRPATANDSSITVTYEGDTYNTNADATIKAIINGTSDPTETFLYGKATHTGNFHYNGKEYTDTASTTITYYQASESATPTKTFAAGSAGTRKDSLATFVYNGTSGDNKTYTTKTGTSITYKASTTDASQTLNEITLAAEGTRKADGTDKVTGAWGNTYTIPVGTGTVNITVSNGTATGNNAPTVTEGTATNTYSKTGDNNTFKYSDSNTYTANHDVTLSLDVTDNGATKTETFTSGSAQNGDNYIVKTGSQVDIGDVTYTASGSDIVTVTDLSAANGTVSGKITGDFSGQTATIGGIQYASTGATSVEITNVISGLTFSGGTFTATGDFSTARTINSANFQVTGDSDVKTTFDLSGVTKLENLGGTATVTAATTLKTIETDATGTFTIGGTAYTINQGVATFTLDSGKVTKIEANTSNGTFTIGDESFTIANDNVAGITFTVDSNGKATKIEGLDRDASGAYVTVTTGSKTINLRRTSNTLEYKNGAWTEPDIVSFYVVTYDGTSGFKVQAVDNNGDNELVNITAADYTDTGTPPTLNLNDKTKEVVVMNNTTTNIKVNDVDGIGKTDGRAIKIDTSGNFKLGTFSGTTFTESFSDNFDVSEKAEFTVDSDGKITVSEKDNQSGVITVEVPKNADLHIDTTGTFKINGTSIIQIDKIDNNQAVDIRILFDGNGNVAGIKAGGARKVTVMPTFASSFDLAESADTQTIYNRNTFYIEDDAGNIVYVIVNNDDDGILTYTTDAQGKLSALSNISNGASVMLSSSSGDISNQSITINTESISGTLALNTWINRNSTTNKWTCGDAPAVTADGGATLTYKVVIENDRVALYYSTNGTPYKKTTNKADYTAAGLNVQPDKDGGALPTLVGNLTFKDDGKVTEIEITPSAASASYSINGTSITLTGKTTLKPTGSSTATFSNGIEVELGTQPITYDGMNFTGNGGTSKATLSSSGITLANNAKVTNVSVKSFTALNGGTLTFDGVTVTNITSNTSISNVITNGTNTSLTIGDKALNVNGDAQYTVDASANKITGIGNGAEISGAFITTQNAEIVTDEVGSFTIDIDTPLDKDKFTTYGGDKKVTFKTLESPPEDPNASSSDNTYFYVGEIDDLDANESITGNFTHLIKVNGNSVYVENDVENDDEIGVVGGNGRVSKIYDVTKDANVSLAGGASTISTDGSSGSYTLGSKKYSISVGTADFISSATSGAPVITGIKNIDGSATVSVYQTETALAIENNSITIKDAVDTTHGLKLAMGGDTISTVDGLVDNGKIEGLSAGAVVKVTGGRSIGINSSDANFKADQNATVYAAAGGYSSVTGFANNTKFETIKAGAILIPTVAGSYLFGSTPKTYTFSTVPILKAGENKLDSIGGLANGQYVELKAAESGLYIGSNKVTLEGSNFGNSAVTFTMGDNNTVKSVTNLKDAVTGLSAGASVQVTSSNEVKINDKALNITDDDGYTVIAANGGYSTITGIASGSTFTKVEDTNAIIIPDAAGTYKFGSTPKTYTFSAIPTLKANGTALTAISLGGSKSVILNSEETALKVGNDNITLTKDSSDNANAKLIMSDGGNVAKVENLKGKISGLKADALVEMTTNDEVDINNKKLQISGDNSFTAHVTADGYDYVTGLSANASVTTAKNVSLVTDGVGTYTFPDANAGQQEHSFEIIGDNNVTIKTNENSAVTEIDGVTDAFIKFGAAETALKINSKDVKVAANDVLKIDSNGAISGISGTTPGGTYNLPGNVTIAVNPTDANTKINNRGLQITGVNLVTVHTAADTVKGYDWVSGLKSGATVSVVGSNAVEFVTDGAGTYTFGSNKFYTDDAQITLKTSTVTSISEIYGLDAGKNLALYQDESGLSVNGHLITVTGANTGTNEQVTLTMGANDTIESVKNLRGDIKGIYAGALVEVQKANTDIQINSDSANLNTSDAKITVHATADGYDYVTGLKGGAVVTTAENVSLVTDGAGTYTFGSNKFYTDDAQITLKTGENGVAEIAGLNGKISGDFSTARKVEGKDILITGDYTAIDILAEGGKVTKIEGLNDGTVVQKSGGASTISTDGAGTFTFDAKTYAISAGTADFLSSGDIPVISGIKNLSNNNVEVTVYQNENSLTVGNNTLKLTVVGDDGIKLTMNGTTISAAENLGEGGEISGLSAGANVHVATDKKVTVNGVALQIDDDNDDFSVKTAANGYAAITGVEGNYLNVSEAVNASIEITTNKEYGETYSIGAKSYTVNGDTDQKVTLVTDGNTSVTAIGGLNGSLKSNASSNIINGANVYSSSSDVWIVATGDNGITSLTGVANNDMVNVPAGVEVQVTSADTNVQTKFTINGTAYNLIGESDSISVKDKTIKGLNANARLTISGAEGNYLVNGKELYITPGRNVVIGEATGAHLYDPDAVDFSTFTPAEEIIERVFGEQVAATIQPADSGTLNESQSAVIITVDGGSATLNGDNQLAVVKAEDGTVNVSGTDDTVIASANVTVNLSGSTNARLMQTADTMKVNGYDYSTGAGIQISNSDVVAAVKEKAVTFGSEITLNNTLEYSPKMEVSYVEGKENIVNLYDITGKKKQTVYYANDNKATLIGDNSANVFVGSWGDDANYSANLYGDNGNDTAFGGEGDFFNLGNGDNYIELETHSNAATIELTATSGNTTVKGFDTGNDIVKLNAANAQVYYTADGLIFTNANGQASLSIQADAAEENGDSGIAYVNVKIDDSNDDSDEPINTAVAREGMAIKVTSTNTTAYVGKNSGVVLDTFGGDINLDNGTGNLDAANQSTAVTFRGITSIKGGNREIDIIGSSTVSNTLEAGIGGGVIWGKGAAGDLLIAADSETKNKRTTFIFENGDGADTISNIQFYDSDAETSTNDKMDVVSISGSASKSFSTSGNDVVIKYTDTGDTMTIKDAVGQKFLLSSVEGSEYLVNVGKNEVAFDGSAALYYATEENSVLKVSAGYLESTIDLKGNGQYTLSANINQVDASACENDIMIVGNNVANTLTASQGESTLFGGSGTPTDDLLIGNGNDFFRYKNGDGNDTISVKGGDTIDFYNLKASYAKTIKLMSYSDTESKLHVGTDKNATLTVLGDITKLNFKFSNDYMDWKGFSTKVLNKSGQSFDIAEDYWENDVYANELLDGDVTFSNFDNTVNIFDKDVKNIAHSNGELWTGNVQYSIASGEQAYNFGELVNKNNG